MMAMVSHRLAIDERSSNSNMLQHLDTGLSNAVRSLHEPHITSFATGVVNIASV